jgi:hypothetical protein
VLPAKTKEILVDNKAINDGAIIHDLKVFLCILVADVSGAEPNVIRQTLCRC